MKILIVDDDQTSRQILIKMLSDFAECVAAENGVQALSAYRQGWEDWAPFDLIMLDISMPEMDGFKVLQTIRAIENEKKVPKDKRGKILMTSARSDRETIVTCVQIGCDDYISKPFDKNTMFKKMEKVGIHLNAREKVSEDSVTSEEADDSGVLINEDEKKLLKEHIQRIIHRFRNGKIELPVLPKILEDVRRVMRNPNCSFESLARTIEKDAVISIRLIAASNSPFYRGTEKITTVEKAIMRLGFQETIDMINAIANKNLFNVKDTNLQRVMEKVWAHSLASAHGAKILAERKKLNDLDNYFILGLIHDIGTVLLLRHLGNLPFLQDVSKLNSIFPLIQRIHSELGAAIIKRWGFPDHFVKVIFLHEGPNFGRDTEEDVLIINLARNLAHKLGYGLIDSDVELASLDSARLLDINPGFFDVIMQQIKENMLGLSDVL